MKITVGGLIDWLQAYPPDLEMDFQGLEFDRLKQRSPTVVQVVYVQIVDFDPVEGTWSAYDPE